MTIGVNVRFFFSVLGRLLAEIHLSLPNRHHLLADLTPFGLDNPNVIFVPITEPFGLIEATLHRGGRGS